MAVNKTALAVAYCNDHAKLLYANRKAARVIARRHRGEHKSPYECEYWPGHWHVGNLHPLVVAGVRTRAEVKKRVA